jgi:hypothetical protein
MNQRQQGQHDVPLDHISIDEAHLLRTLRTAWLSAEERDSTLSIGANPRS